MSEPGSGRPNPLTDTLLGLTGQDTQTLRVIRDGSSGATLEASARPAVDPGDDYRATRGPLGDDDCGRDLLALSQEVMASEVEALAVSLWDGAGWESPGVLRLCGQARLRGPYELTRALRTRLRLPSWAVNAFVLDVPEELAGPIPPELVTGHPLVRAYRADQPAGTHWEAVEGLYAMARRLAGAWRIAATRDVLQPDPDSATTLSVYAPTWLEQGVLQRVLVSSVPGTVLIEAPLAPRPRGATRAGRRRAERAAQAWIEARLGVAEVERIAKEARAFDEMMASTPLPDVGYSLTLATAQASDVAVHAQPVDTPPPALRWESWAGESLASYTLSWLPRSVPSRGQTLSRVQRIERLRATEAIEALAAAIYQLIGGAVLDEDGFLVAV